jgi:hypothetical protein
VSDLVRLAQKTIDLIDNYVDDSVLVLLQKRNPGVRASIFTQRVSKQLEMDLEKHNAQYPPIAVRLFKESHDRFLILDGREVYHIGASIKDLGKKWFAFTKIEGFSEEIVSKLKGTGNEEL